MTSQAADQHGNSLSTLCADIAEQTHVIVASNRGPVSFTKRKGSDGVSARTEGGPSSGALAPLEGTLPLTWISASSGEADRIASQESSNGQIVRGMPQGWTGRFVFPSRRSYHRFYNVICNPLLWFLHHRSWGFTHTPNIDREAHNAWEGGMVEVSRTFAQAIADEVKSQPKRSIVLLRDYHMHLVGGMTRKLAPEAAIHYMVDVPWPEPSDWLFFPAIWRDQVFRSMLSCDVVGFSSNRDARSFLRCVEEFVPDAKISGPEIELDGQMSRVRSYVPGLRHEALMSAAESNRTLEVEDQLDRIADIHTFVTAERAEPHKNIVRCLRAYGAMLDRDRNMAQRTRYLLALAPPPPHLSQYRRYLDEIKRTANEINRKYGKSGHEPVQLHVENNFPLALAAMKICDTLVSAPIADAQSVTALSAPLVNQRDCSMIISETCGASELFGAEPFRVSPTDSEAMIRSMTESASSDEATRQTNFEGMRRAALSWSAEESIQRQLVDLQEAPGSA